MTTARQETRNSGVISNVVSLHDHGLKARTPRQQAVQQLLSSVAFDSSKAAPIASALAVVRPDGTVDVWARGIEKEIAPSLANALDDLSLSLRRYAPPKTVKPWAKRTLYTITLAGLATATFVNEHAWLDVLMMLASGAVAARLFAIRPRFRHTNPK